MAKMWPANAMRLELNLVSYMDSKDSTTWGIINASQNLHQQEAGVGSQSWDWKPSAPKWDLDILNPGLATIPDAHPRLTFYILLIIRVREIKKEVLVLTTPFVNIFLKYQTDKLIRILIQMFTKLNQDPNFIFIF